ncbi:MAG: radical SAM protein, partial [Candidatus Omnitrophica bacterium]|nr:radical SAM protein [Candidatus Omnitrophota bacterium]
MEEQKSFIRWGSPESGADLTEKQVDQDEDAKRSKLAREKPYVYEKIMKYNEKVIKGESIAIIQFQYNYRCNFHCQHCDVTRLRKKGKHKIFTPQDVKKLSRQADEIGLAQIVITGGEPLVFPDFDKIVEAIDPSKFWIVSDTNGWFLDEEKAKHLKKIGVDKIQLSVDGLDSKEHDEFRRKSGSHQRCLRALDASLDAGLNVIIQTVV